MRWYESAIICLVIGYFGLYFDKEFDWLFYLLCGTFISFYFLSSEDDRNQDRRVIYAILAFLWNPIFTYLHYSNNMPIYGMSPSDFTDIFSMFGRAVGAFLIVTIPGLLTLLFNPKKKWETYWLVTMIIAIVWGSWTISSNSF